MYGKHVNGERLEKLIKNGAKVYDVRDPVRYRDGALSYAENMQLRQVSKLLTINKNTTLVFMGDKADSGTITQFLQYASQYGFTKLFSAYIDV